MNEEYLLLERDQSILEVALKAIKLTDASSYAELNASDGWVHKSTLEGHLQQRILAIQKKQRQLLSIK